MNQILFIVFPYVTIVLAIVVTIYRTIRRPFSVSSYSTQLLENRKLFWGSISFHYGIVLVLLGHLAALLLPQGVRWWNSATVRLYVLELTGLILGVWAVVGTAVLIWRRISERRVRVVTTPMDWVVLALVAFSAVTGVITASTYRFGSNWFTAVFTPYLLSILILQPRPELLTPLPWLIQLHALNFFILLAVFPFSRLVHIITLPVLYLIRPWQIVVWQRRKKSVG